MSQAINYITRGVVLSALAAIGVLIVLPIWHADTLFHGHDLLSQSLPRSGIVWDNADLKVSIGVNESEGIVSFYGFNGENTAIRLESVKPSCSCVTIESSPVAIGPKESFCIVASIYVPQSATSAVQAIAVKTQTQTDLLHITATRPVYMTIDPRAIIWDAASMARKSTKLTLWKSIDPGDIMLKYDTSMFTVSLQKTSDTKIFELSLSPQKKDWRFGFISVRVNTSETEIAQNIYMVKRNNK